MQLARPAYAPDPRQFGRRPAQAIPVGGAERSVSEDLKLFAITFAAAFLFVSILIG